MKMIKSLLNFVMVTFLCFDVLGQTPLKVQQSQVSVDKKFRVFYEKVYLHLDRDAYASGDDIWFKAYLVNGQSNYPTFTSYNLYVELISPELQMISREVIRMDNGVGKGDIKLNDSIPSGTYRIRAYTQWMLNFDELFVFEKDITIQSSMDIRPKPAGVKAPISTQIHFFPEGGSLVNNVLNVVAFKATNKQGKGCSVQGAIVNDEGDTVCHFTDSYLGMGKFNFIPVKGHRYTVLGIINKNIPFEEQLTDIQNVGFAMELLDHDSLWEVHINANAETLNEFGREPLKLEGKSYGKIYLSKEFAFTKPQIIIPLKKCDLPTGITCLTLYDNFSRPCCERLLFTDQKQKVNLIVTTDKNKYQEGETVQISIKAADTNGLPVSANLSLSAVNADLVTRGPGNIISYLMLSSEIKGTIENAPDYFDPHNGNRYWQLDLLLMTQGWRDFLWKRLEEKPIHLRYMMEPGITIKGRVRQRLFNIPLKNENVTLSLAGSGMRSCKTDSLGNYYFDGLNFSGEKKARVVSAGKKGKTAGWIFMDPIFAAPLLVKNDLFVQYDTMNLKNDLWYFAQNRYQAKRKYHLTDTIMLNEVQVKGRFNNLKSKYGLMENGSKEFIVTPKDYDFYDLSYYVQTKIPKLQFRGGRFLTYSFRDLIPVRFNVIGANSERISQDEIISLELDKVNKIVLVQGIDIGGSDHFYIEVYVKPNAFEDLSTLTRMLNGYYENRVFSPYSSEDNLYQPTIYWKPDIVTDKNGEAIVMFKTSKKKSKLRITVEGISGNGVPLCGELNL